MDKLFCVIKMGHSYKEARFVFREAHAPAPAASAGAPAAAPAHGEKNMITRMIEWPIGLVGSILSGTRKRLGATLEFLFSPAGKIGSIIDRTRTAVVGALGTVGRGAGHVFYAPLTATQWAAGAVKGLGNAVIFGEVEHGGGNGSKGAAGAEPAHAH